MLVAQDDWKIRPNLHEYRLRWNTPASHGTQNRLSNYIFGSRASSMQRQVVNQLTSPIGQLRPGWVSLGAPVLRGKVCARWLGILYERTLARVHNIRQNTPFFAEVSTCCFFDPGKIVGPPPGSNILYALGSSTSLTVTRKSWLCKWSCPDGALCGDQRAARDQGGSLGAPPKNRTRTCTLSPTGNERSGLLYLDQEAEP